MSRARVNFKLCTKRMQAGRSGQAAWRYPAEGIPQDAQSLSELDAGRPNSWLIMGPGKLRISAGLASMPSIRDAGIRRIPEQQFLSASRLPVAVIKPTSNVNSGGQSVLCRKSPCSSAPDRIAAYQFFWLSPRNRYKAGNPLSAIMMPNLIAQNRLEWIDGSVPVSQRYGDRYFSADDPMGESEYVFLSGNGLPGRFRHGFHIAELGFGAGLNMLSALSAWCASGAEGRMAYTGFEASLMPDDDIRRALSPYPKLAGHLKAVADALQDGETAISTPSLEAVLVLGDARETLSAWKGRADAWFLDGFSPARNPEIWEAGLLQQVARRTRTGGTFATYTAAGSVRRALSAAGFSVERKAGFGRKRHMLRGQLNAGLCGR